MLLILAFGCLAALLVIVRFYIRRARKLRPEHERNPTRQGSKERPDAETPPPPRVNPFAGVQLHGLGWTVADVADFEYLLRSERAKGLEAWERDRAIYRELLADSPGGLEPEKRHLVRSWLEARRHLNPVYLGGRDLVSGWKLLVSLAFALSFLVGVLHAGAVLVLFDQNGHVSVIKAALATVGVQLLVTALALLIWVLRKALGKLFGEFRSVRVALLRALLPWSVRKKDQRPFSEYLDEVSEFEHVYRPLVLGHVFIAAQFCVIAMSLGLLTSLQLYHYASEDVRFGWSATHNIESEELHQAVKAISAPWWSFTAAGQPTLSEIEESRLSRDRSFHVVSKNASQAWASFLTMSILTYGVLMRLVFLIAAMRTTLGALAPVLRGGAVEALMRRMRTDPPSTPTAPALPPQSPEQEEKRRWWWPFGKWGKSRELTSGLSLDPTDS